MKLTTHSSVVLWLNSKHEVRIEWSGGHDSGGYELEYCEKKGDSFKSISPWDSDCPELEKRMYNKIMPYFEDRLGYRSFAGDFSVEGTAIWDKEKQAFVGETNESIEEWTSREVFVEMPFDDSDDET